jgi:Domain of unknown function (DUF6457)
MATLDEWVTEVSAALGLPPDAVDVREVLDLARDVAHGVDRPAAPVTAYLAGLAVGRGAGVADVLTTVREVLTRDPA